MPIEGYKQRLILADGTVLENCSCGYSSRSLWCYLKGISFGEAFQYFSGPEKFGTITYEMEYTDFTDRTIYSDIEQINSIVQSENTVDVHLEGYKIKIETEHIIHRKTGE